MTQGAVTPSPSGRRIAFLTNPTSGKGKGVRFRDLAAPALNASGADVRLIQGTTAQQARDLAERAVAEGADTLVVCGGDGLVHLGLQVVAGTDTTLGIIPAGTGNDVARFLDLPRKDPVAAANRIIHGEVRHLDLARSASTWYATVLAAGFDALVNERANAMSWPHGQMRYNLATVAELRTFQPLPYFLELDGVVGRVEGRVERRVEAMLVAVGNGPSFGGGLRITEGAVLDDGLLDVVIIKKMSKLGLVTTYPKLFSGTHIHHPAYEHHRVRRVTVAAPGITAYADGERFGALPLTVEAVPAALKVWA